MMTDKTTSGTERKEIVGEVGPEDEPIEVRTEPLPDDGTAYGVALLMTNRGWRNVEGRDVELEKADSGGTTTDE